MAILLPAPSLGRDGLFVEDWLRPTRGDLRADLAAAAGEGKVLALLWEREGCPYCAQLHLEALRDPSGAVDSLGWTYQGLRVLSDQWPPEADALLQAEAALDWPLLGRMADRPQLATRI